MGNFGIKIDYEKSHGSYVYDKNSNRFILDFLSHFSSLPLGYKHPILQSKGYLEEVNRVCHIKTSLCEYGSDEFDSFLKSFREFAVPKGFDYTHFACTGGLSVEAAIKSSWAHHDYKRKKVVSFHNSFHGVNSFGNFLTTSSRLDGIPTVDWVEKFDWTDAWQSYIEIHHEEIAAVIVEPIQCTYGDYYVPFTTLKRIRELCTKFNIVLIYDEIQTGLSTGQIFYFQHYEKGDNIEPDIIVFGKKFQISGIIVREGFDKIKEDFWRLKVTYDGDALDAIRSKYIIKAIEQQNLLRHSTVMGFIIRNELEEITQLKNVRGMGGLVAFDFDTKELRDAFYKKTFENGLMANPTGEKTIRLRPSLAVTSDEVYSAIEIIKKSLQ